MDLSQSVIIHGDYMDTMHSDQIEDKKKKPLLIERPKVIVPITLDVCGTKMITNSDVIKKMSKNNFDKINNKVVEAKAHDALAVRRNPEIFKHVIQYMESDQKYLPPNPTIEQQNLIKQELKYW